MPSLLSKYRKKRDSTRSDDGSERGSFGKSPKRKVSTSSSLGRTADDTGSTPGSNTSSAPNSVKRTNGLGLQLTGAVAASPNRGPMAPGPQTASQAGPASSPAQRLAGYSTAPADNYIPPRQPQHLDSPFVAREDAKTASPSTPNRLAFSSPQGAESAPAQQQERDLEQLREHDRSFQERYKQSVSSPPSQSPAHFFNLPASENPWAEWQIRRACPSPRFGHSANYIAARDGELFVMGGIRDMDILSDLWVIDTHMLTGYQLRTEGATVSARVGHSALTLGNAYILFGGDTKIQESDPLDNNLYLLNTTTLRWTVAEPKGPRPTGRYGHSLVNVGVKVYVFGGQVDDMFYSDMWVFDLTSLRSPSSHWQKVEPMSPAPPPRTNHTVVTFQDKIYLFGGANRDLWYSDTWCYDPAINEWTQLDCTGYVPAPCQGHAATIIGDTMYVFGGMSSQGNLIDQLFALKLTTHKWYTFQNLGPGPCPRSGHSLTAFDGDKILVWGGTDQSSSAFVLDVSRINYPDENAETDTSAMSIEAEAEPAAIPSAVPAVAAIPASSPADPMAEEASAQLTRETSARSTPAARNSILLKRQSWQQQQSGQLGQPAVPLPTKPVLEEEAEPALDLPKSAGSSLTPKLASPASTLSSVEPIRPLSRGLRQDGAPLPVPVTTAGALARAEAEAEAEAESQKSVQLSPSARTVAVKEAQDLEEATANMPGALPRSDAVHNLNEESEVGSGTPDTLWRATSSSSEDTEVGSSNKMDEPELEPVLEHAAQTEPEVPPQVPEHAFNAQKVVAAANVSVKPKPNELVEPAEAVEAVEAVEPAEPAETNILADSDVSKEVSAKEISAKPDLDEPIQVSHEPIVALAAGAVTGLGVAAAARSDDVIPARKSVDPSDFDYLRQQLSEYKKRQDSPESRQGLARARRELLDHQEELGKVKRDHAALQAQYDALHGSTAQTMALVAAANAAAAAAREQAVEAVKRADALAAENAELRKQVAAQELGSKEVEYHSTIEDLMAKWTLFPAAGAVAVAGSRELAAPSDEAHYRELYESQKKVLDETQGDLDEAYRDMSELQEELKQAQSELEAKSEQVSEVEELRAFKTEAGSKQTGLEAQLAAVTTKCAEMEAEYSKSVEYLQNQQNALSKTRAELARIKESHSKLEDELSEARLLAGPASDGADPDASAHSLASLNYKQADMLIKDLKAQVFIAEEERDELREQLRKLKRAALAERV